MRRQAFDIDNAQPMPRRIADRAPALKDRNSVRGKWCRNFIILDHFEHMGNSNVATPRSLSRILKPATKSLISRHVREHVVGDNQIGATACARSRVAVAEPKKATSVGTRRRSHAALAQFAADQRRDRGLPRSTKYCNR